MTFTYVAVKRPLMVLTLAVAFQLKSTSQPVEGPRSNSGVYNVWRRLDIDLRGRNMLF